MNYIKPTSASCLLLKKTWYCVLHSTKLCCIFVLSKEQYLENKQPKNIKYIKN